MGKRQAQQESFVIRVWREPGWAEWRIWVQHVRSGQTTVLQNLNELGPFIECWVAGPVRPGKRGLK